MSFRTGALSTTMTTTKQQELFAFQEATPTKGALNQTVKAAVMRVHTQKNKSLFFSPPFRKLRSTTLPWKEDQYYPKHVLKLTTMFPFVLKFYKAAFFFPHCIFHITTLRRFHRDWGVLVFIAGGLLTFRTHSLHILQSLKKKKIKKKSPRLKSRKEHSKPPKITA